MNLVFGVLYVVTLLFFLLLMTRLVLEWVQVFARDWRPQGILLVIAEVAYTATDPPIRAVRKVLPPLRIGRIALDLGFLIVAIACSFLLSIFAALAHAEAQQGRNRARDAPILKCERWLGIRYGEYWRKCTASLISTSNRGDARWHS